MDLDPQATTDDGAESDALGAIQEVRVMRLQPDDIVVAKVADFAKYDNVQAVKKQLEAFFAGHRVLVVSGLDLEIARRDDDAG